MKDLNKLRNTLQKRGFATELNEPTNWISMGNATVNHALSGRFDIGMPNMRSLLLWGPSGGGKSFFASNACKAAQDQGYIIVYIDTEESLSYDYMEKIGIDTSEDVFLPIEAHTIEEVTAVTSEIFQQFDPETKFILVIDSLAGLMSEKEAEEYDKGTAKGDMGRISKSLKLLVKNLNRKISEFDAFLVMVTHAYMNQDLMNGEGRWICTGGKGLQFFPSMSILLEPWNLKDKDKDATGIRIKGRITKTRFTAPRQTFEINVPYDTGIDFTEGMLPILVKEGALEKNGGWYSYADENGELQKFQESKFMDHYEIVMKLHAERTELVEEEDNQNT